MADLKINSNELNNRQDLENSLSLFGESKETIDLEKEFSVEVSIPKETTDNIMKISRSIKIATLTISGYQEVPANNKNSAVYRLVKHPLAGSKVIKMFESVLQPYGDESNMISKKTWESFVIQARSTWRAFWTFCLRERTTPDTNLRAIYNIFQVCLLNAGEIICDNPDNMKNLFGTINKELREEEGRNFFKNDIR